jgi:hypothetical protein
MSHTDRFFDSCMSDIHTRDLTARGMRNSITDVVKDLNVLFSAMSLISIYRFASATITLFSLLKINGQHIKFGVLEFSV